MYGYRDWMTECLDGNDPTGRWTKLTRLFYVREYIISNAISCSIIFYFFVFTGFVVGTSTVVSECQQTGGSRVAIMGFLC